MLSSNSHNWAAIFICIFLSFSCASNNQTVKADFKEDPIVAYDKLRSLFEKGHDEEDPILYSKWTDYVRKILVCDNNDYLQALEQLGIKYMEEIVRAGECMRSNRRSRENHSSKWLDDLIEHYGLSFVKENRALIMTIMQLSITQEKFTCKDNFANILFQEAFLHAAYQHYLNVFLEFYETLDQAEKTLFKSRQEASTLFLELIDKMSYAPMVTVTGMPTHLIYENFARRGNEELFNFMESYISFQNFHPMEALNDYRNRIDQDQ
jgi:hypothetical protein